MAVAQRTECSPRGTRLTPDSSLASKPDFLSRHPERSRSRVRRDESKDLCNWATGGPTLRGFRKAGNPAALVNKVDQQTHHNGSAESCEDEVQSRTAGKVIHRRIGHEFPSP